MIKKLCLLAFLVSTPVLGVTELYRSALQDRIGARDAGMGMATIAKQQDGATLLQNPAGLVNKGYFYHYEQMDLQSQSSPLSYGHFFRFGSFGVANIHQEDFDRNKVEATILTYSQKGKNNIDWGVSYKNFQETISTKTIQTWSTDLGVIFHASKSLTFGASVYDALAGSTAAPPTSLGVGSLLQWGDIGLAFETVFRHSPDTAMGRYGLECLLTEGLCIRGGWFDRNYTFGATLSLPVADLTYASLYPEDHHQSPRYLLSISIFKEKEGASREKKK